MKSHTFFSSFESPKLVVMSLLFLTFSSTNAQQAAVIKQGSDTAKSCGWVIKADPFWPVITIAAGPDVSKVYSFAFEKFISPYLSLQLTTILTHYTYAYPFEYNSIQSDNTYMFAPQLKYYLGKANRHKGLFVGIYAEYALENDIVNSDFQHSSYYTNYLSGGIVTGVQYYITRHLAIEAMFGVGEQITYFPGNGDRTIFNPEYWTLSLLDVNIGYKF
ncbi:MAG TPA: DUF3575 domain-containing protein [Bacteroidia bacterium]|jgi:hypothetical protein|nr:DUF3575 domain-containing protein [Bacteroidia bacterium]